MSRSRSFDKMLRTGSIVVGLVLTFTCSLVLAGYLYPMATSPAYRRDYERLALKLFACFATPCLLTAMVWPFLRTAYTLLIALCTLLAA
jgi:hypothetical protein